MKRKLSFDEKEIISGFDITLRPQLSEFIRKIYKRLQHQNKLKCYRLIKKDLNELSWSSYGGGKKITRTILKKELNKVLNSRLGWDYSQRNVFLDKIFAKPKKWKRKSTKLKAVFVQGGAPGLGKGKS